MASKSSFLPRIGLSNDQSPWASSSRASKTPLRSKRSEYDLDDLSPQSDRAAGSPPLKPGIYTDNAASSMPRPETPPKIPSRNRVLFTHPPPPIAPAKSRTTNAAPGQSSFSAAATATSTLYGIGSAIFSGRGSASSRDREGPQPLEQDTTWHSFQRREKSLQRDVQRLLDVQSAGLSAGLGRPSDNSTDGGQSSESSSPAASRRSVDAMQSRLSILDPPTRANGNGEVMPVRQPRRKPMGLRAARAGLGRTMALLADLRAEEDACLASALGQRKNALARVRKMNTQRDGLLDELRVLEMDDDEPLARELRGLQEEHGSLCGQIDELEKRLAALKNRRRRMESEISSLVNRREAGLSGYRGALKEVDAKLAIVLSRPPVKPLDMSAFGSVVGDGEDASPGGLEFLSLHPERRTAEMAMDWWEREVKILERRKMEIDKERAALEEGAEVWSATVKLVTDFETDLRSHINADESDDGGRAATQEDVLRTQLSKMHVVMGSLEENLQYVEEKGWNLLICAIGAELEAFREAHFLLRKAMVDAGIDLDDDDGLDDDTTPRIARSRADTQTTQRDATVKDKALDREVDGQGSSLGLDKDGANYDNDGVPRELLTEDGHEAEPKEEEEQQEQQQRTMSREVTSPSLDTEESDNEVPLEFLSEHRQE